MSNNWQKDIEKFCDGYNLPIAHIADTLYEPKVVPMIRGKAFEYSVIIFLQGILPENEWRISKATIKEEAGFHDTDVRVLHKRTGLPLRVECKLAKKEGYRLRGDGHSEIIVKCMRSRTLGITKAQQVAPKLGVESTVLLIHNDQYLTADFDVVVTSIGNAFYRSNENTGLTEWAPNDVEIEFLYKLGASHDDDLKSFAFNKMYIARSRDIAARSENGVICSRRKCINKDDCGFIPNYPIIVFDNETFRPTNGWVSIEECSTLFKDFIS